jgi:hypothetical protein
MFQFCKEFGMCDLELELGASALEWQLLLLNENESSPAVKNPK